jgi:DNA-binding CsgD family transcriptional regulator
MINNIPAQMGEMIQEVDSVGAAIMFSDFRNKILYSNAVFNKIYERCGDLVGESYDTFALRCIEKTLLDDPFAYEEPEEWINKAKKYREGTKFGQYLIRHHTGNIYLVRHQIIDGCGTLSVRLDITRNFHSNIYDILDKGFGDDGGMAQGRRHSKRTEEDISVGVFSPISVLVDANEKFLEIMHDDNGLCLKEGRICASSMHETKLLHRTIYEYCDARQPVSDKILRISKTSECGYYLIKVGVMFSKLEDFSKKIYGTCIINIIDPLREISLPYPALQQAFNFTAAEARVAIQLASGATPEEIALRGNVSVGTVRNQIKSISKKASVNKRADLVRVLANLSRLIMYR